MSITVSNRNVLLGIHTTPALKRAIRAEAYAQDLTMSMLTHKLLTEKLRELGYNVMTGEKRGPK